jgi:drug/metabolite transporter (DMT)-like permease
MLTVILGIATSLVYGFADFFGAIASRKIAAITTTFLAAASGLFLLLILVPVIGADFSPEAVAWGAATGVASAVAISFLYASLAIGPISIVSPLGAVVSAIVPMIVGYFIGDRFSAWGWLALALILVAVVLVGFVPGDDVRLPSAKGLIYSVAAGAGIGLVLILLDQAPDDSGIAPLVALRSVSATLLGLFVLVTYLRERAARAGTKAEASAAQTIKQKVPAKFWYAIVAAGFLDATANVLFITATRVGTLSVVSVLTALYPLGTILLARIFLKEKIATTQSIGIALALAGSAIIAVA